MTPTQIYFAVARNFQGPLGLQFVRYALQRVWLSGLRARVDVLEHKLAQLKMRGNP